MFKLSLFSCRSDFQLLFLIGSFANTLFILNLIDLGMLLSKAFGVNFTIFIHAYGSFVA